MNMPATDIADDILTPHLERDLPVQLTDAEQLDRFKVASKRKADLAKLEAQAKRARDEWKDRIDEIETEIAALELAASTGKETRPVECYERFKGGSVETIRRDTGEVAFVRTATPSDRQLRHGALDGGGLLDTAEALLGPADDDEGEDDQAGDEPEVQPHAKRGKKRS